jgi:hypothetical protein
MVAQLLEHPPTYHKIKGSKPSRACCREKESSKASQLAADDKLVQSLQQNWVDKVRPGLVKSDDGGSGMVKSGEVRPGLVNSGKVRPGLVKLDEAGLGQIRLGQSN